MNLRNIISKLIKGEKAISAVTASIKLLGAIIAITGSFYGGYLGVKKIMFNKWAKEQKEYYQLHIDSVFRNQVLDELMILRSGQDSTREEIGHIRHTQVKQGKVLNALDESYPLLLQQMGKLDMVIDYQRMQLNEKKSIEYNIKHEQIK